MFAGGAWKSAVSNHRSGVGLSSLPSPMRFGHDGAPLLTPVFRKTVNGRPVERVTIPLNCQFSRMGFREAAVGDGVALAEGQHPDPAQDGAVLDVEARGPRLWSKSVMLCGPPTAPPPEAPEPA